MKLTVHLEGANRAEIVKGLQAHLALLNGGDATAATTPSKKSAKVEKADDSEEFEMESEASFDGDTDDSADEADAEPTHTKDDVRKALAAYAKKYTHADAMAILGAKGVKKLDALDESDYADVMAATTKKPVPAKKGK